MADTLDFIAEDESGRILASATAVPCYAIGSGLYVEGGLVTLRTAGVGAIARVKAGASMGNGMFWCDLKPDPNVDWSIWDREHTLTLDFGTEPAIRITL